MIARRNFLLGLGAAVAAPAVIRTPGLLMPVRKWIVRNRIPFDEFSRSHGYRVGDVVSLAGLGAPLSGEWEITKIEEWTDCAPASLQPRPWRVAVARPYGDPARADDRIQFTI